MSFAASLERMDVQVQEHLGGLITYQPAAGPAVEVRGIFDQLYQRVTLGEPGVSSSGPAVWFVLADLPDDVLEMESTLDSVRVTVGGKTYRPVEVEPDGKGGVLLRLHEV